MYFLFVHYFVSSRIISFILPSVILTYFHFICSCLNRADIIRVYDGKSSNDAAIQILCNEGMELEVLSTGSDLFVEFVANSDWPGQGFKASFQFQSSDDNSIGNDENNCTLTFFIQGVVILTQGRYRRKKCML